MGETDGAEKGRRSGQGHYVMLPHSVLHCNLSICSSEGCPGINAQPDDRSIGRSIRSARTSQASPRGSGTSGVSAEVCPK